MKSYPKLVFFIINGNGWYLEFTKKNRQFSSELAYITMGIDIGFSYKFTFQFIPIDTIYYRLPNMP